MEVFKSFEFLNERKKTLLKFKVDILNFLDWATVPKTKFVFILKFELKLENIMLS